MANHSFTGRTRVRYTRWTVRLVDRLARGVITLGGLGVIIAVCFVFVFLGWVVLPLFQPGEFAAPESTGRPGGQGVRLVAAGLDEYQLMGWSLYENGSLVTFRLKDGKEIARRSLVEGAQPTAIATDVQHGVLAFGFEDGSVRLGRIGFSPQSVSADQLPANLRGLKPGETALLEGGIVGSAGGSQLIVQRLDVQLEDPIPGEVPAAVRLLDLSQHGENPIFAAYTADGVVRLYGVTRRTNLLTGKVTLTLSGGSFPLPRPAGRPEPKFIVLSGVGDSVSVLWEDGHLVRLDTRDLAQPKLAETLNVLPKNGLTLTSVEFLIGKATLVTGQSDGGVTAWFRIKPPQAATSDGAVLTAAHDMRGGTAPVTALAASSRTRMIAAGYADGSVRLFHVTSSQLLAQASADQGQPIRALVIAPKDDGLMAFTPDKAWRWPVQIAHPEATVKAIFTPVWYEGYLGPEHVWQSSSGTDDFEPKLGMVPLIFGTIKATFYSMLFSVPVALLAAVYTSEFLHARTKARIKPTIEVMASLPSVVLGFLAAIILAPFVENVVPHVVATLFTLPFVLLLGAHLWQLLPERIAARYTTHRLWFVLAALPVGVLLGWLLGSLTERWLFAGDIKLWLDGQIGTGTGGWFPAILPLAGIGMTLSIERVWSRRYGAESLFWERRKVALAALAKFLGGTAAAVAMAYALSWLINAAGWDPRGSFVGTYVQRNALVVGFVMAFAVIPIIYTLSEDALSAVPDHLRSGSLAAGATPWQTAVRIVIPTAMSGLFSAVMIGFGRAVGETMVVLMAAGNTPLMDWNMFNGFRTLSANIAVELPEAVRNSTHYRTLFLAALTLFVMTFFLNTLAEMVRQRFRKRAYQL